MAGKHVTEAVWLNAQKELPDSPRQVAVVFRHFSRGSFQMRIAQGAFFVNDFVWKVDSSQFNPSADIVTQWAEIEPERGGFIPDPFPNEQHGYAFVSNKG